MNFFDFSDQAMKRQGRWRCRRWRPYSPCRSRFQSGHEIVVGDHGQRRRHVERIGLGLAGACSDSGSLSCPAAAAASRRRSSASPRSISASSFSATMQASFGSPCGARTGPPNRITGGAHCVGADQLGRDPARLFQVRRARQTFLSRPPAAANADAASALYLPVSRTCTLAAGRDNNGRRGREYLQAPRACGFGVRFVEIDRQRDAVRDILFGGLRRALERRRSVGQKQQGRRVGALPGEGNGDIDDRAEARRRSVSDRPADGCHASLAIVAKRAQADKAAFVRVPKQRTDERAMPRDRPQGGSMPGRRLISSSRRRPDVRSQASTAASASARGKELAIQPYEFSCRET